MAGAAFSIVVAVAETVVEAAKVIVVVATVLAVAILKIVEGVGIILLR